MPSELTPAVKVAISQIALDDKQTMVRAVMNEDAIKMCAQRWLDGGANPFDNAPEPIRLFVDGDGLHWIGDGRHRIAGAVRAKQEFIRAVVTDGTKWDALEWALRSNTENGTSYTPRDNTLRIKKMNALHPEWVDKTIANALGLSVTTVNRVRAKLPEVDPEKLNKERAAKLSAQAKTKDQGTAQVSQAKQAVKAKTKAVAAKEKAAKPEASKVTDAKEHGKVVAEGLQKLESCDACIQESVSKLVKAFDARREITKESNSSEKHYGSIVQNMDLVITEWKAWKRDS